MSCYLIDGPLPLYVSAGITVPGLRCVGDSDDGDEANLGLYCFPLFVGNVGLALWV